MPPRKPTAPCRWMRSQPAKTPKARIPAAVQSDVTRRAQDLVETVLKPRYVHHKPPAEPQWNHIVDVGIHWYHSYLYFCATYCCPGPTALTPSFEERFARMEFAGPDRFHLAFRRHTGEWIGLYEAISLDTCLNAIRDDPWFQM